MHLLCVGRQAQLTRLHEDGFPLSFLISHRRMRILGACYHAVATTNTWFSAGMGKGNGELSALSLLNFWLALVAACAAKTAAPWVRGERSAGQMPVTRSVCALGRLSAAQPICAGKNPCCRTRARVRQSLLATALAMRIARRNLFFISVCLSSTKTLRMGSDGEGAHVFAFCEWAKATLIGLPDVHRSGVRDIRLWRGSKSRSFLLCCFLMQISLSERKNGHNTA